MWNGLGLMANWPDKNVHPTIRPSGHPVSYIPQRTADSSQLPTGNSNSLSPGFYRPTLRPGPDGHLILPGASEESAEARESKSSHRESENQHGEYKKLGSWLEREHSPR